MKKISSNIAYIPIRANAKHSSEQVSQLIFGESADVLDETGEWYQIKTDFDNYLGWVEKKVCFELSDRKYKEAITTIMHAESVGQNILYIPHGGELYYTEDLVFTKNDVKLGLSVPKLKARQNLDGLMNDFIGAPYLWGGRTIYGIDCSGLTQVIMKCLGIKLPRDAPQQAKLGTKVDSIKQSNKGDLAFFHDQEGKITHVGIIIEQDKIFHASGYVRIDKLDQKGIFDESNKVYTHSLKEIKRLKD